MGLFSLDDARVACLNRFVNRNRVPKHHLNPASILLFLWLAGCANPPSKDVSRYQGARNVSSVEQRVVDRHQLGGSTGYKVDFIGADLFEAPNPNSSHIADIPEGTILVPLAKESYFIKVSYEGKIGWVSLAGLQKHVTGISTGPAAQLAGTMPATATDVILASNARLTHQTRDKLKEEYRQLLISAFPTYNGIQVVAPRSNFVPMYAIHPLFTEYEFAAGPLGPTVARWIAEHNAELGGD